jgi:hypothetical protein
VGGKPALCRRGSTSLVCVVASASDCSRSLSVALSSAFNLKLLKLALSLVSLAIRNGDSQWGLNDWGQTGSKQRPWSRLEQVKLPGAASMVGAGYLHSYALVC